MLRTHARVLTVLKETSRVSSDVDAMRSDVRLFRDRFRAPQTLHLRKHALVNVGAAVHREAGCRRMNERV